MRIRVLNSLTNSFYASATNIKASLSWLKDCYTYFQLDNQRRRTLCSSQNPCHSTNAGSDHGIYQAGNEKLVNEISLNNRQCNLRFFVAKVVLLRVRIILKTLKITATITIVTIISVGISCWVKEEVIC